MSVNPSRTMPGTVYANPPINVFDSLNGVLSKYPRDDPDLGAPNTACGPILDNGKNGLGRGNGGKPFITVGGQRVENPYKDCDPLGNLLIIQNGDIRVEEKANDSPFGGCMEFEFNGLQVTLNDFGLLDLEETVEITVRNYYPLSMPWLCCCSLVSRNLLFDYPCSLGDDILHDSCTWRVFKLVRLL
jgi:hypothetical protein